MGRSVITKKQYLETNLNKLQSSDHGRSSGSGGTFTLINQGLFLQPLWFVITTLCCFVFVKFNSCLFSCSGQRVAVSKLPDAASHGWYGASWHGKGQTRLCTSIPTETSSGQTWQAVNKTAEHHRPGINTTNHAKAKVSWLYLSRTAFPELLSRISKN